MRLLMGIIFITLVHLGSFKAIEDTQDSWTKHLRRTDEHQPSRPARSQSETRRRTRSRTRSQARRTLTTVSNGDHHSEYSTSRTNHFTSTSSPMSLGDALNLLAENHDTKPDNFRPSGARPSVSHLVPALRHGQNPNILHDQPRPNTITKKVVELRRGTRGRRVAKVPSTDKIISRNKKFGRGSEEPQARDPGRATAHVNNRGDLEETAPGQGDCGPDCQNLLHELGHPKEATRCPQGQVIDIWGYCRDIFHEERRDWDWWRNLRIFVHSGGNSWYNTYRPTAREEQGK